MDIKKAIEALPTAPGVYMMKDSSGEIIYVGKAANIRKRASSYFRPGRRLGARTEAMVARIAAITHIPTSTEAEALIYENGLIKGLSPKYNVALKDGKSYPLLKLTAGEKFPKISITRIKKDDGALYYGPYADAKLLRRALIELRQIFPLRSCGKMGKKVCLDYHIKQCLGPCEGKAGEESYKEMVSELKLFLEAKRPELIKSLSDKMREAASRQEFEAADIFRKRLEILGRIKGESVDYAAPGSLDELGAVLGLGRAPDRIEAFDVSDIMGTAAVGSMISFRKGKPYKAGYRRFRIKTVYKMDDYAMMREIVRRRYLRLLDGSGALPDLIVIDGGKGHLSAALEELDRLGIRDVPVIGIAKEFERIYVKGRSDAVILPRESKALHLLKRIRDEAHRFAVAYHKSLMSKRVKSSELDRIPLIGDKRKRALMRRFGAVARIRDAGLDELVNTEGMDERSAKNIIEYFKKRQLHGF